MKSILIVDTYYPAFLQGIEEQISNSVASYLDGHELLMNSAFGTSDSYSAGLKKLGWDALEIVPNSRVLQSMWAHEHGVRVTRFLDLLPPSYLSRVPLAGTLWSYLPTLQRVLSRQIDIYKPDVVYFQDLNFASSDLLRRLRRQGRLVVGQIASPLPPPRRLRFFDLILSSLPNQIDEISRQGILAEFLPIAFDRRVLARIREPEERDLPLTFVGGISSHHRTTIPLLETIVQECPELTLYGYGADSLSASRDLSQRHFGEKWGLGMYETLRRSRVTVNRHIDVAEEYANNMRLFEATGVGTLLVTDKKRNLSQYFEPGVEVLAYETFEEAAELCRWALDNPDQAAEIARAGQARTLRDHTYDQCMVRLGEILQRHI